VELPFTVVFEPPSQSELRTVLRMRGTWVAGLIVTLAIGSALALAGVGHADPASATALVPLEVRSQPLGADVWLDSRPLGRTPLATQVEPGSHSVVLKARDALDGTYAVPATADAAAGLDAVLWRRQPGLLRLRPALPGAVLRDVRLLLDGQLGLVMSLPDQQLQAWRLEPRAGGLTPLSTAVSSEWLGVATDGRHIAWLGYEVGPPSTHGSMGGSRRPDVLWLASDEPSRLPTGWRAPLDDDEQLRDVSWSPRADRLLVVAGESQSSSVARARLWLVDAATLDARQVMSFPSDLVRGSVVWSPDGTRVAFLAHAGVLNALCLLDLDGGFRYLADLEPTTSQPLAYPPAAWSRDSQQLAFVAPRQAPAGTFVSWLQPELRRAIYMARTTDAAPLLISETDLDRVTWREDGQLLGLGRLGNDGALDLRLVSGGSSSHLVDLTLRPVPGYGAAWDVAHARLLLANPAPAGSVEYWLALLGLDGDA
jgi:hypothetical protein